MKKTIIQDSKGSSTLVTLGLLASVSTLVYVSADASILVAKRQRDEASNGEINAFSSRIRKILATEWSCTASLAGANYLNPLVLKDPVNAGVLIAQAGASQGSFWSISRVTMSGVHPVAGLVGAYTGRLDLLFTKNMQYQLGSPTLFRSVQDVTFAASDDGTISHCYPSAATLTALSSTCQTLGGAWDSSRASGSQCSFSADGTGATDPSRTPSAVTAPSVPSAPAAPAGMCLDSRAGLIALPNSIVAVSGNGRVASDVLLLNGSKLTLTGNASTEGTLYKGTGCSVSLSGNAQTGGAVLSQDMNDTAQTISNFSNAQAAETPDQHIGSISESTVLVGSGGRNVILVDGDVILTGNSELTLSGKATDVFVINVKGKITVAGNGSIKVQGGLLAGNVVFNNIGAGNEIVLSGNGQVSGTFIGLQRGVQISGNGSLTGSVAAGGGVKTQFTISGNGLEMTPNPFCVNHMPVAAL